MPFETSLLLALVCSGFAFVCLFYWFWADGCLFVGLLFCSHRGGAAVLPYAPILSRTFATSAMVPQPSPKIFICKHCGVKTPVDKTKVPKCRNCLKGLTDSIIKALGLCFTDGHSDGRAQAPTKDPSDESLQDEISSQADAPRQGQHYQVHTEQLRALEARRQERLDMGAKEPP